MILTELVAGEDRSNRHVVDHQMQMFSEKAVFYICGMLFLSTRFALNLAAE